MSPTTDSNSPTVIEFVERRSNSLVGFATVRLSIGIVFHDVNVHRADSRWWAVPPTGRPYVGRDGKPARTSAGVIRYVPDLGFLCEESALRFSNNVLTALCEERPRLFCGGGR